VTESGDKQVDRNHIN